MASTRSWQSLWRSLTSCIPSFRLGTTNVALPAPSLDALASQSYWHCAYDFLRHSSNREMQKLITGYEDILVKELNEVNGTQATLHTLQSHKPSHVATLVNAKLQTASAKRLALQAGGHTFELRSSVKSIVRAVSFLRDCGVSTASNADAHASLAFGGICLLLPVRICLFIHLEGSE